MDVPGYKTKESEAIAKQIEKFFEGKNIEKIKFGKTTPHKSKPYSINTSQKSYEEIKNKITLTMKKIILESPGISQVDISDKLNKLKVDTQKGRKWTHTAVGYYVRSHLSKYEE